MQKRHLIVGVDPGSTIGIAAIDLGGNFVQSAHSLGGGIEDAISIIERLGTPSLIAIDVRPAPSFAVRVAAAFNVPLFVPERPWREEQKSALLRHLQISVANAHERDALSAAVMAFRANQNTLSQASGGQILTPLQKDRLRHLLLQGIRQTAALQMVKGSEAAPEKPPQPPSPQEQKPSSQKQLAETTALRQNALLLERANAELRKRVTFVEAERDSLKGRVKRLESGTMQSVLRDRLVSRLQYEVGRLKKEIEWMRRRPHKEKKNNGAAGQHSKKNTHHHAPNDEKPKRVGEGEAGLKTFEEKESDIERIIREYRKGRTGQ